MNMIITQDESKGFSYTVDDGDDSGHGASVPNFASRLIEEIIFNSGCEIRLYNGEVYKLSVEQVPSKFQISVELGKRWLNAFDEFMIRYTSTIATSLIEGDASDSDGNLIMAGGSRALVLHSENLDRFLKDFSLRIGRILPNSKFHTIKSWKSFGVWADVLEPLFSYNTVSLDQSITLEEIYDEIIFALFDVIFANCSDKIKEDCADEILYIKSIIVQPFSMYDNLTKSVKGSARVAIEYYAKKDSPETQRIKWLKAECGRGLDPSEKPMMSPIELNAKMEDGWKEMQSRGGTGSLAQYLIGYK